MNESLSNRTQSQIDPAGTNTVNVTSVTTANFTHWLRQNHEFPLLLIHGCVSDRDCADVFVCTARRLSEVDACFHGNGRNAEERVVFMLRNLFVVMETHVQRSECDKLQHE